VANRILAIGDIHGCHIALSSLLKLISPTDSDIVVALGDIVDRGPDSADAIQQLINLSKIARFIGILGNHDEMFLDAVADGKSNDRWLSAGGLNTVVSYCGSLGNVPDSHVKFLESFRDSWESDSDIFVHANIDSAKPLADQTSQYLRWTRLTGSETPHCSGKRVICGHTGLPTGVPAMLDGFVDIDTWAYGDKWLTCLDTGSNLVYQASQAGDTRGPIALSQIATDFTRDGTQNKAVNRGSDPRGN